MSSLLGASSSTLILRHRDRGQIGPPELETIALPITEPVSPPVMTPR